MRRAFLVLATLTMLGGVFGAQANHDPGGCAGNAIETVTSQASCTFTVRCPAIHPSSHCRWDVYVSTLGAGLVGARATVAGIDVISCGPEPVQCGDVGAMGLTSGRTALVTCSTTGSGVLVEFGCEARTAH